MIRYTPLLLVTIAAVAKAANVGQACTTSSDCTVTNSECSKDFTTCAKGMCMCKSGYTMVSATSCLLSVAHGAACDATKSCPSGMTCSSDVCACTTSTTYNSKTGTCITDTKKVISEECSATSDCIDTNAECVANTGTTTPKYCRCTTGYITDTYQCRNPYHGESCASVACASKMDVSSLFTGANQETPTCQSSKCACPSTANTLTKTYSGMTLTLCQTKFSGTMIANGQTCTASNACTSNICYQCPGESTSVCVVAATDGASHNAAVGTTALLVAVLARFLM